MRDVANPAPTNVYYLQHPEMTDATGMFDCEIAVMGEKLVMKRGRIETEDEAVCKALVRMGYRWMNEPF